VPSSWCLAARISLAGLPPRDRDAMLYRLEEKLPLAAEAVTADFIPDPKGQNALGVCAPNERVAPLLEALEAAGVAVQSISPLALLALQGSRSFDQPGRRRVAWPEGDRMNLFVMEDGLPVAWALSSGDPADYALHINFLTAEFGQTPHNGAVRDTSIEFITQATADQVLSGRLRPWVELRRGAMAATDPIRSHRGALNAALAAAAVLLVAIAAALVIRGTKYDRLAESLESQLREDFRREFPGWAEPPNVGALVASERRRMDAAGAGALPAEARRSALTTLHDVLAKLPRNIPLSLSRATFNDISIQIEGEAKSQADVEPLVVSARSAGLEVPPPQIRKSVSGTWSFVLRGDRPGAAGPALSAEGGAEP
jgi:hypothetical protein